ncbi:Ankyrin repeat protein 1 [Giardia muris]|uniref:Ankyrin repeat protein 1 n=1 Tax=Giardia muris TaxID=5742 RepID=A0A4Z1T0C8_GIAMU|nr:Ankyrin repeat protein 1 [Giardia muris]|eukprot:TNJ30435.1 Ankyrin repeat protein 1 [Giardia muris]
MASSFPPLFYVRGLRGGDTLMLSRGTGAPVRVTTKPYSAALAAVATHLRHRNLLSIYGEKYPHETHQLLVSEYVMARPFSERLCSSVAERRPLSSMLLSFLFVDFCELIDFIIRSYRQRKLLLTVSSMHTLIDTLIDIEHVYLNSWGSMRVRLDCTRHGSEIVAETKSSATSLSARQVEAHALQRLGRFMLILTFYGRGVQCHMDGSALKDCLESLTLCPIYRAALQELVAPQSGVYYIKELRESAIYQSLYATAYVRRGMHEVIRGSYSIFPLHSAIVLGDSKRAHLLTGQCAGMTDENGLTGSAHILMTLKDNMSEFTFLFNICIFLPEKYETIINLFHLRHIAMEGVTQKNLHDPTCLRCMALRALTRAYEWHYIGLDSIDENSLEQIPRLLYKSLDYGALQERFPILDRAAQQFLLLQNLLGREAGYASQGTKLDASGELAIENKIMTLSSQSLELGIIPLYRTLLSPYEYSQLRHQGYGDVDIATLAGVHTSGACQSPMVSSITFHCLHQVPLIPSLRQDLRDSKGQTVLMHAVVNNDLLRTAYTLPFQRTLQNSTGCTASILAAIYDHPEALSLTLPHEALIADSDGWAALTHAARWLSYDSVMVAAPLEAYRFGSQALSILANDSLDEEQRLSNQALTSLIQYEIQRHATAQEKPLDVREDSYGYSDESSDTCVKCV